MERKVNSIRSVLLEIDGLERATAGEQIESSDALARRIAKLLDSLSNVYEEGRSMDESSMLQIPAGLLDKLDDPNACNPDLFQISMLSEAEARAMQLKKKIGDLETLRGNVEAALASES